MLLVMIVTMTAANNASAQIIYVLLGGVHVTDMSLNSSVFDASNRTGFFVGPTIKVQLPLVGLGIDASALYDQREAKIKVGNTTTKETLRSQAINIPINLRYGWGLSSMANIFLFAGPQFGYNVGDKDQKITESSTWSVKNSNFSLNFGAGVTLLSHLQLTANYNVVCGKTSDATITEGLDQLTNKEVRSRANAWQIALAYYF